MRIKINIFIMSLFILMFIFIIHSTAKIDPETIPVYVSEAGMWLFDEGKLNI